MSRAFLSQLPYIGTTSTLGWQNDALAQSYMDHILQRARVLLPRRGWRVGVIKEFYPRGASLLGLNVNAGSEICVRFRVPGKRSEFLPFHEVLCTALHEFTHCVHSRHDRAFWDLYYDLVKECEALEVTMIQQGKQLYPEEAYVPQNGTPSALAPLRRTITTTRSGGAGATSFPSKGGHRLGGEQKLPGRGGGNGSAWRGRTKARSSSGATTTTITAQSGKSAHFTRSAFSSPPSGSVGDNNRKGNVMFPGEGRRLGEGTRLRRFDDASPGFTPTRDALRRILAAAVERRMNSSGAAIQKPCSAVHGSVNVASSSTPSKPQNEAAAADDAAVDEEDVPDHIPQSQCAIKDGDGSWRCPRCGFCNEAEARSCAFCDDDTDTVSLFHDILTKSKEDEPSVKKERHEEAAAAPTPEMPNENSAPLLATANAKSGMSKDNAVEVSDDDE